MKIAVSSLYLVLQIALLALNLFGVFSLSLLALLVPTIVFGGIGASYWLIKEIVNFVHFLYSTEMMSFSDNEAKEIYAQMVYHRQD